VGSAIGQVAAAVALLWTAFSAALVAAQDAPPSAGSPHALARAVTAVLDGPRTVVFDTAKDSCELIDIPDSPAHAFRDDKGMVHLFATHYVARASVGPTLEAVRHDCEVVYRSDFDANPANFDDHTWLNAFYSIDGRRIVALGHMEYQGWTHPGMCSSKGVGACWYNAETFHLSSDGGYHFSSPKPPANFSIGPPYKYDVNQGPEGYSVDTNIIKAGAWYYATVSAWGWPPYCGHAQDAPCLLRFGVSPIRTSNILDPSSWRGWNGIDFAASFVDPYHGAVADPQSHVLTPVPNAFYMSAINFHAATQLFIATIWDGTNTAYGPQGLYFSTSQDFIHWGKPTLVITLDQLRQSEPSGKWNYAYFSLIDPKSSDLNYATVTDEPYLYYVRSDMNHAPYVRVLFRQKLKLSWR
jgi:hypothetical protein